MTLLFIRSFFVILSVVIGFYVGSIYHADVYGAGIGCVLGLLLVFLESKMHRVSMRGLSSMVFGLLLGVFMANLIADIMQLLPLEKNIQSIMRVVLTLIFSFLGAVTALRGKDEFNVIIPYVRFKRQDIREEIILLDTSVIIDGRAADIYKTRFLSGRLVVPRFVLQELQTIADSADSVKRERGRRGLDILRQMQNDANITLRVQEDDIPDEAEVDAKLVRMAKLLEARICTTDYNLSSIATIQGVEILNINDLVNAVKTVVIAGEELEVKLLKEGKEADQAIGYLDDGTMIVVGNSRKLIGQKIHVIVSSVLQTQAGRMIFAKLK